MKTDQARWVAHSDPGARIRECPMTLPKAVIPAKAGTHSAKVAGSAGIWIEGTGVGQSSQKNGRPEEWIPPYGGTTEEEAVEQSASPRTLTSHPRQPSDRIRDRLPLFQPRPVPLPWRP
jgi:hypothetical protein